MIVTAHDGGLRVITQHDHAALAADLLTLWRRGGVADHRWREAILRATREHDNGWQEADAAPSLTAEGTIHDYRSVPAETRRRIWLRGCRRFADERPLEASLILAHCEHLHQDQRQEPEWSEFFERLSELRSELAEAEPETESIVEAYPYLRRADWLALAMCEDAENADLGDGFALQRLGADADDTVRYRLTPLPFAGSTRFRVAARCLNHHSWPSSVELTMELARSPWTWQQFLLQE